MKLEQYKPEIEFIEYCKQCNKIYKIEKGEISSIDNQPAGHCCDSGRQILLPYTNCKDYNNNKLYLFDVVKICNYGNLQERNGIVIFEKGKYTIYVSENERWNLHTTCDSEDYIERIGNIYELKFLQK